MADIDNVVDIDATLELQLGLFAFHGRLATAEDGVALAAFLTTNGGLFAAKNNALKKIDVVLSLGVTFKHKELVFKEEFAKLLQLMVLPVFDSFFEVLHSHGIFLLAFCFIDLVGDAFNRF